MVVVQVGLDAAEAFALNHFDGFTHIGIGTGTGADGPSRTTLETEVARNAFDSSVKNAGAGTYDFTGVFTISQADGQTITEVAIFDAASSGTMALRKLLPVSVSKSSIQLEITVRVTVTASNN
jgi:hypothetical protein